MNKLGKKSVNQQVQRFDLWQAKKIFVDKKLRANSRKKENSSKQCFFCSEISKLNDLHRN